LIILMQAKVSQGSLLLASKSVLLLEGPDIAIKNLRVDGALVVRAVPGAKVVLDGLTVSNQGWTWTQLDKVGAGVELAKPEVACQLLCVGCCLIYRFGRCGA
jgi:UDP-sugar pyrophosphorylase